ncbi:hypothetical protein C922_05013 [Plasmodium inui San Antonio 1]|uniref:Uncharacterized protein n=1 Tax=Plasmodium inui San Antonio 1 TaxID=1237626 RepID=W6ZZ90_9APIC|nr:hypothetical protein C922_05013 [Plasmodium inui San Antonio 1]EUD64598.1 hypothetical protein C922_05013 [Plasmodium inui San Antonio 1]
MNGIDEGHSLRGGGHVPPPGDVRRDLQGGVHVATLRREGSESQGVQTHVMLDGMEDQATMKEGRDREGEGIPPGNNPLMLMQPCGAPGVANAASSKVGCEGTTQRSVDYAKKTIANAKEILKNNDQCVLSESKLEANELNDIAEILHSRDGEMMAVGGMASIGRMASMGEGITGRMAGSGNPTANEPNDADMTVLFESSTSSLPFILKGISETLDHILSVDKIESRNKNQLIQVVQDAHMLLRSNYNLVLKCDSNLAIIVKKIRRLYRLYRKLDNPEGRSRKGETVVGDTAPEILPIAHSHTGEPPFIRDPGSGHGGRVIIRKNQNQQDETHQGDANTGVHKRIWGATTQDNDYTSGFVPGGNKQVQRNVPSSVASSVRCGYSWNVGEGNRQVDPPCGGVKSGGGKRNGQKTLLMEGSRVETLLSGGPSHEATINSQPLQEAPLQEVVSPTTVGLDQRLPYAYCEAITVKDCPPSDTQEDSSCVGKKDRPIDPKKLRYSFVNDEEGRSYENLMSIDSKSTVMSNHKEDAGSSVTTEGRTKTERKRTEGGGNTMEETGKTEGISTAQEWKKTKKAQQERIECETGDAENAAEMHPDHPADSAHTAPPARSPTKERNNKKKERKKKRILRELSKLNSLFFFTFNHKGDIINYLHREIRSSISEFDAAYQLYVSR